MVRNRKGLAPWSLAREAGIESATVDGTIDVPQYVQPTIDTGFVDERGDWKGVKSSDKDFIAFQTDEDVANGAAIITPGVNPDGTWPLDMAGYKDIMIAIKPTNGGNYGVVAVMGPADIPYANLSPVNAAATLRGISTMGNDAYVSISQDSAEAMTADVWNIFSIQNILANQKLLQFKITNNSGDASTIEAAFMRLV